MFRIPAATLLMLTTAATAAVTTGCVTVAHRPAPESLLPRPVLPAPSVEPNGPEVSRPPARERPATPPGSAAQRPAPALPSAPGAQRPQRPESAAADKKKGKGVGRSARGKPEAPRSRRYGPPWPRAEHRRPAAPAPGLCKLAREYGRWQDDDRADTLCRDVYGD
ncbi:hypothetical protein [Streptomyces paromomycinus]|uniref:Lipoprotein n=1 Tax=Streptomyces paromomycinus TaxID=92743 RepID=A0A401WE90_STREY|nr:hypothetical protein [Streptomyces paromomycinus]GCD47622.1 hypothetical protein GKJPGBOP_07414 [Streptomyces paromomycinus]